MTDPIITEADRQTAIVVYSENRIIAIALALAQARAEGRLAGMEDAALVSGVLCDCADRIRRLRARTTKEGSDGSAR